MAAVNKTTLIVNYLPQQLTDAAFAAMFAKIGVVVSSKIVRDRNTGYSFGFGFVEYANEAEAAAAIAALNGTCLLNKTIKVAYSRQGEKVKGANLYVSNLPKSCDVDRLSETFSSYGNIVQCRILSDQKTGVSRGIGFVLYDTRDEAERAVAALNGKTPDGFEQALHVTFAEDRGRTNQATYLQAMGGGAGAYGGGYGSGMGDFYGGGGMGMMESGFYGCGGGGMMMMPKRGGFRGDGGVMRGNLGIRGGFLGAGDAFSMMPMMGGRGRMIRGGRGAGVRFNPMSGGTAGAAFAGAATEKGDSPAGHVIFVYNIGAMTSEEDIRQLFSLYGTVVNVDVIWDYERNVGKGYAFVTMPNYDEAAYAIQQLSGYNYAGKPLQVSFKSDKQS